MQLTTLFFAFTFVSLAACKALPPADPPIHRLLQVFGVPTTHRNLQPPPQYMLDLYKSVADDTGMAKAPNPHNSKVIRSFNEKGSTGERQFMFNISGLAPEETILEAELHVHLTDSPSVQPHVIYVYQITDADAVEDPKKNQIIDVRHVSGSVQGWQVFRVRSAVDQWISGRDPVLALAVQTAAGVPLSVNISRHGAHHPVLILFNDDGSQSTADLSADEESGRSRRRRDLPLSPARNRTQYPLECHREELYVDFESIGWSEWIIAPKGYNAYHCSGVCTFPLGQSQKPTNHATVQSIIHEMKLTDGVARPCCVPSRLLSLSLLYYDENDNVVLKQYGEMVADSCGCH